MCHGVTMASSASETPFITGPFLHIIAKREEIRHNRPLLNDRGVWAKFGDLYIHAAYMSCVLNRATSHVPPRRSTPDGVTGPTDGMNAIACMANRKKNGGAGGCCTNKQTHTAAAPEPEAEPHPSSRSMHRGRRNGRERD